MKDIIPIYIRSITDPFKIFASTILDFASAVIGSVPLEEYTVQKISTIIITDRNSVYNLNRMQWMVGNGSKFVLT